MTSYNTAQEKEDRLKAILRGYGSVAIAYSGGVDSSYLADVAHEVLGDNAHMLIADSPSIPRDELKEALDLARSRHWRIEVIQTCEFDSAAFLENTGNRCYHCKKELFSVIRHYAETRGIGAIVHGETAEDSEDETRVGAIAARENDARAPLAEAAFLKADIRERSEARGLPTWDKASFACLASRIPVGISIDAETLGRIEQAESLLRALGCRQYRARHHDTLCRIEVEEADMPLLLAEQTRARLVREIQALGYRYVVLDLAGYRMGNTAR